MTTATLNERATRFMHEALASPEQIDDMVLAPAANASPADQAVVHAHGDFGHSDFGHADR